MYVGQTTATRDLTPAPDAQAPAPVQAPPAPVAPASQPDDTFGPATVVEVKAAPAPSASSGAARVENVISIDQETKAVVFQQRSADGTVVFQLPDDTKLKIRAYFDELAQHQTAVATAGTHPDPSQIDGIRI